MAWVAVSRENRVKRGGRNEEGKERRRERKKGKEKERKKEKEK